VPVQPERTQRDNYNEKKPEGKAMRPPSKSVCEGAHVKKLSRRSKECTREIIEGPDALGEEA